MGSSKLKPGDNCLAIRKRYPMKRSGFYWIQPFCSQNPIRVYCDFNSDIEQDFLFYENLSEFPFKSIKDLELVCASEGLELLDITSSFQYQKLYDFFQRFNIFGNISSSLIPIAYDPKCSEQKCSRKYKSLSSKSGEDVFETILKNSPLFLTEMYEKADFLSIGKYFMTPFNLEKNKIKGVLCSTNRNWLSYDEEFIQVKCSTNMRYNPDFQALYESSNVKLKIKCPKNCLRYKDKSKVWGTTNYKDDSSICLSAIHDKKIDEEKGGFIAVKIEKKNNTSYIGTQNNQVISLDWNDSWDTYFIIEKYELKCPIDKFRNNVQMPNFFNDGRFFEVNTNINDETPQSDIYSKIQKYFNAKKEDLNYFTKISEKSGNYLLNIKGNIDNLKTNHNDPDSQRNFLQVNEKFMGQVRNSIKDLLIFVKQKINLKKEQKQKLLKQKINLNKVTAFNEDYLSSFEKNWHISQELRKSDDSYTWSYKKQMVLNHTSFIECSQNSQSNFSSFLLLKNKMYYDAIFRFSFLSLDFGLLGVVFRYQDAFNYYILEFSRSVDSSQNFKRIRKIKNGISEDLFKINDGGFLENTWFFSIKFVLNFL